MSNPQLVAVGEEALRRVKKVMNPPSKVEVPSSLGMVQLRSGTVLPSQRMLVWVSSYEVAFMEAERLYTMGTQAFLRDEYLLAMSRGAQSAAWLIPVAHAEMALLTGIFIPWYVLLGITAAKTAATYYSHKQEFNKAFELAPRVIENLRYLQRHHSSLFNVLARTAAKEIFQNLPSGVTAEDIAFFVGRCIKGLSGVPEIAFLPAARVITVTAALVTATHLPSIAAHTASHLAKDRLDELRRVLEQHGVASSDEELNLIIRDMIQDNQIETKLRQLDSDSKALLPVLETLKGYTRVSQ